MEAYTEHDAAAEAADGKRRDYGAADVAAMKEAIALSATALQNAAAGEEPMGGPFGAVIYKDGKKVAGGCNHVLADNDPSAHGEVYTIRAACKALGTWDLSGCVLYTSCEPCPMCLATSLWARVDRVYFAANRDDAADAGFDDAVFYRYFEGGPEDRAIMPVGQEALAPAERVAPFTEWNANVSRIDY